MPKASRYSSETSPPSAACLIERLMRRRAVSSSMILTHSSSPAVTTWSGRLDVVRGHLRDVHETLDALAHLDERAEGHELGDAAVDQLVDRVAVGEDLPRVGLGRLQRERDALLGEVDVEDLDVDLVADGDDLARVVDVLPAELGDVDESVHAAQVHEGTEVDDRGDDAVTALAGLEVREEVAALFLLGLFEPGATREHHVVAVAVEFDDLRLDGLADVGLELAHAAQFHERRRAGIREGRCRR